MKRQRGRNRSGGGGGGRPQHNTNRAFDSNGPDGVKVRGAAQHVYEKYQQFARDAHTSGDRVLAENYLQHAEHYFRVMRAMQPLRPLAEIIGRDNFVSGYDIDFEEESQPSETAEADGEAERTDRFETRTDNRGDERSRDDNRGGESRGQDERPRYERGQNDRPQFERPQGDHPRDGRYEDRQKDERPREDRPRDDRPRDERPRDDRFREDRFRDDRPRDDRGGRGFRDERPRYPRQERQPAFERAENGEGNPDRAGQSSAPIPEPSRNPDASNVLRAEDGDISHAPAFLQVRPLEPRDEAAGEGRRPRRRRASGGAATAEAAAQAETSDEG